MKWPRYIDVPLGELPKTDELRQAETWFKSFSLLNEVTQLLQVPDVTDIPEDDAKRILETDQALRRDTLQMIVKASQELQAKREAAQQELAGVRWARVRVASQHPDDAHLRKLLGRVSRQWNHITAMDAFLEGVSKPDPVHCPQCSTLVALPDKLEKPPLMDSKKAQSIIAELADFEAERDKVREELFVAVLTDKHAKEEVKELIGICTLVDVRNIFYAAKGYSVTLPEGLVSPFSSQTQQTSSESGKTP